MPEIPQPCFAHSLPDLSQERWETLQTHSRLVADLAAGFARAFGWEGMAAAAGWLHDAGKASAEFQAYIRGGRSTGGDHSTFGARQAAERYGMAGRILALVIAGHHAGLSDADALDSRLDPGHTIPAAPTWSQHVQVPEKATLRPSRTARAKLDSQIGQAFTKAFAVRMLFSCLVDADFLATEQFMSGGAIARGIEVSFDHLTDRFATYMTQLRSKAVTSDLNTLRERIMNHAVEKAALQPGLFTMSVPTGGGKTLATVGFALAHARRHKKRRIVYVIPFTSIIEQTAGIYRTALGEDVVLEHHASFDWEQGARETDGGDERDGRGVLGRAAENWDAPIVVTTAVQFFESLFANRTSRCRKLHNLADSIIVLDEAQTLPVPLLLPCLAALDELQRNYGATVVFCTATQPAVRQQDGTLTGPTGENFGLDIAPCRELAPDPDVLYDALRRVRVEVVPGSTQDETVAQRFAETPQMLCIVNNRAHARELFGLIADLPGAAHLTTLMCPAHRRRKLAEIKRDLAAGKPVRLIATSLIEAGVDISFPEVWRAIAGLDSIAQAAGRCNREGLLPELGRVVVFTPADGKAPSSLAAFQDAARAVLPDHADPLARAAISAYFAQLYRGRGISQLDAASVGGRSGILNALHENAPGYRFPFESIATAFRLIDEAMQPVIVPYDQSAREALERVARAQRAPRADLRRLQQFMVGIPRAACRDWVAAGAIVPVRRDLGDALLQFADDSLYNQETGIDLTNPTYRRVEENLW